MKRYKGEQVITTRNYLAVMVIAALFAFSATTQAAQNFSLQSMRGTWGFSASGTLGFGTVQAAAVGLLTFDGAGACSESAKLNAGGAVLSLTSTGCSYTVNPDGSGSLTVTFLIGTFTTDFVIVDVAKEFHFLISDAAASTVASGIAQRQVR